MVPPPPSLRPTQPMLWPPAPTTGKPLWLFEERTRTVHIPEVKVLETVMFCNMLPTPISPRQTWSTTWPPAPTTGKPLWLFEERTRTVQIPRGGGEREKRPCMEYVVCPIPPQTQVTHNVASSTNDGEAVVVVWRENAYCTDTRNKGVINGHVL